MGNAGRVNIETAQPELVEMYYGICALVDQHNRSRQANLKLETKLHTKDWATRLNLSIVGICTVDAWKLWKALQEEDPDESTHISEHEFYLKLAEEMVFNTLDQSRHPSPVRAARAATFEALTPTLVPTTRTKRKKVGADEDGNPIFQPTNETYQGRCKGDNCNKKTIFVCSVCRAIEDADVHFCNPTAPGKRKACNCTAWVDHINSKHPNISEGII